MATRNVALLVCGQLPMAVLTITGLIIVTDSVSRSVRAFFSRSEDQYKDKQDKTTDGCPDR